MGHWWGILLAQWARAHCVHDYESGLISVKDLPPVISICPWISRQPPYYLIKEKCMSAKSFKCLAFSDIFRKPQWSTLLSLKPPIHTTNWSLNYESSRKPKSSVDFCNLAKKTRKKQENSAYHSGDTSEVWKLFSSASCTEVSTHVWPSVLCFRPAIPSDCPTKAEIIRHHQTRTLLTSLQHILVIQYSSGGYSLCSEPDTEK